MMTKVNINIKKKYMAELESVLFTDELENSGDKQACQQQDQKADNQQW
jgi:hypothetical protein